MSLITTALESIRLDGTYRTLRRSDSAVDFSSNDYLGLSNCPRIRQRLIEVLESGCPVGSTGSRLLSGHTDYHERVETYLSETYRASSCLLFSSGYMANLAVLTAFGSLDAAFFSDELNHASLIDGMKITKSLKFIFKHNDVDHLRECLESCTSPLKVIVTESVFSMEGDLAPLQELGELASKHGAWLVIDEAHATGVFGKRGLGRLDGIELDPSNVVSIHTGGKALGAQGAFVLAERSFRELLINRARTFIFTTALSPLNALQIEFALREIENAPDRGAYLLHLAEGFRKLLSSSFDVRRSGSQILPIVMGSNERVLKAAEHLNSIGFGVRAIRSPTVAKGTERLRIALNCSHRIEDLNRFTQALREFSGKSFGEFSGK